MESAPKTPEIILNEKETIEYLKSLGLVPLTKDNWVVGTPLIYVIDDNIREDDSNGRFRDLPRELRPTISYLEKPLYIQFEAPDPESINTEKIYRLVNDEMGGWIRYYVIDRKTKEAKECRRPSMPSGRPYLVKRDNLFVPDESKFPLPKAIY